MSYDGTIFSALWANRMKGAEATNRRPCKTKRRCEEHALMKAVFASIFTLMVAAAPIIASPDDQDRVLANVKGSVTWGQSSTPTNVLALHATTPISDNDYAATGPASQATLTFSDSSQVIIGQSTSVQVVSFSKTDIAHAKFAVVGKVRFRIVHPQGAQADYTFQTGSGQIAVRGTEGDLSANPNGLQVNVYSVSNPSLPVQVTLANGQVFTIAAGQSLVVGAAAGALTASVTSVSQTMFQPFSEFGAPANASSLGISAATTAAAGASTGAVTAAAAALGAAAAAATLSANGSKSSSAPPSPSPSSSPSPVPSTTSVPITVSGSGRDGNPHPGPHPSPLP
jgi:ferric-dicitrate binding protein FerR (iron transport regulator)